MRTDVNSKAVLIVEEENLFFWRVDVCLCCCESLVMVDQATLLCNRLAQFIVLFVGTKQEDWAICLLAVQERLELQISGREVILAVDDDVQLASSTKKMID